jgi:uncharacterized protein YraI
MLMAALLILAACGPERGHSDDGDLNAQTLSIAQAFAQDNDTAAATISLQSLDVANPMQWLVLQTETAIAEQPDAGDTQALAKLAIALGSQSHDILDFGAQTGIVPSDDASAQQQNTASVPVAQAVVAAQATPVALPTVAVIPLESAEAGPTADTTSESPPGSTASNVDVSASASPAPDEATASGLPTATPESASELPTATPVTDPQVVASTSMNVRSGPGTAYPIVDDMGAGQAADILATNAQADWWQVQLSDDQVGWVYAQLVETRGDLNNIAVASDIPDPPEPTATPVPVAAAPEEAAPEADASTGESEPAAEEAPAASGGPDFRVIEKRLWNVYENGGYLSGPTVTCGEKRQLVVNVVDANGNRINGVAVQEVFGAQDIEVTGAQGKGDGVVEFILGRGQDVHVIRDSDGREVTSEVASGMVTEPAGIPYETLIGGQFCTDDASCKLFVDAPGCWGHYSWTVTFQRNY